MIELGEKDIKVVGNARFFRRWRWRMGASLIPFAFSWVISWVLVAPIEENLSLSVVVMLLVIIGLLLVGPLMYWERRQRRDVAKFVEEWKASKGGQ